MFEAKTRLDEFSARTHIAGSGDSVRISLAAGDATVARYFREVRSFLRWCVNHEYAKRDVGRLVTRKPKQNTQAERPRLVRTRTSTPSLPPVKQRTNLRTS